MVSMSARFRPVSGSARRSPCHIVGLHVHAYDHYDPDVLHCNLHWALNYFYGDGIRSRHGADGSRWEERPGRQARLVRAGVGFRDASIEPGHPVRGAWLSFYPAAAAGLDEMVARDTGVGIFDDPDGLLGALLAEWDEGLRAVPEEERVFELQNIATPLVDVLRQAVRFADGRYRILSVPPSVHPEVFVARLHQYVSRHYTGPIRLSDMAQHMGVSPSCLSHRYARMTGDTPASLLLRTRVTAAARLLEQGVPAKAVAVRTGFCDLPHLSRTFRQCMGLGPREFLTSLRSRVPQGPAPGDVEPESDLLRHVALIGAARLRRKTLPDESHVHASWILDLFLTPGVRFRSLNEREPWEPHREGWLRLYRPGCRYWEDDERAVKPIESLSVGFFVMRGSWFWQKFAEAGRVVYIHDPAGEAARLMDALADAAGSYWTDPHQLARHAMHALFALLSHATPTGEGEYSLSARETTPAWIVRVQAFLKKHLNDKLTTGIVAQACGVRVGRLGAEYRVIAGEPLSRTLLQLRVRRAGHLIATGHRLADVAAQAGFHDAQALTRAFKKIHGHAPRAR